MATLRTTLMPSLDSLSAEELEEITADGHVFAGAAWFRMLQQLDLSSLIGGQVELLFAVVTADDVPIAVCPVFRARGEGMYFVYSLQRYFFEHWIDDAVRLNPQRKEFFARLFTGVSAYRKALAWTGSSLDDCLIVASPLSYRGNVAVAPSSPVARHDVYHSLLAGLKKHSRRTNLPLWFLCVEGEKTRLGEALQQEGLQRSFLFYDNRLNTEPFVDFDGYLNSFRRTTRRAFQKDIRKIETAGVEFEFVDDISSRAEAFTELYNLTYAKYGDSYFRQPPEFWKTLQANLGSGVEAIVAQHENRLVGFSILLKSQRRGEMWTYRIGRRDDPALKSVPYYFGLSFYGPIQRAIELGYRRLWLGPASYEAKSVRGAEQVPLYSYFWFPRRWDRWFLLPYLQLFGQVTREQIAASMDRPIREDEPAAAGAPKSPKDLP